MGIFKKNKNSLITSVGSRFGGRQNFHLCFSWSCVRNSDCTCPRCCSSFCCCISLDLVPCCLKFNFFYDLNFFNSYLIGIFVIKCVLFDLKLTFLKNLFLLLHVVASGKDSFSVFPDFASSKHTLRDGSHVQNDASTHYNCNNNVKKTY